jgi:hypothetical protein
MGTKIDIPFTERETTFIDIVKKLVAEQGKETLKSFSSEVCI